MRPSLLGDVFEELDGFLTPRSTSLNGKRDESLVGVILPLRVVELVLLLFGKLRCLAGFDATVGFSRLNDCGINEVGLACFSLHSDDVHELAPINGLASA